MIKKTISLMLLAFIVMLSACSKSTPIQSQDNVNPSGETDDNSALIIESGTFFLDKEPGISYKSDLRTSYYNFNITGFLSVSCPGGCFSYQITGINGTEISLKLTLENPTALQVYDVRIIFDKLYGKKNLYPDNYTDIFHPFNIRPFNVFNKYSPNRAFPVGPGATSSIDITIDYPSGAQPNVDYTIIASYPSNTAEPYEIFLPRQWGNLSQVGDIAEIGCFVYDYQNDISLVAADTSVVTGGITFLEPSTQGYFNYHATITNSQMAPPGKYVCPLAAMSPNPQNAHIFDYITLIVDEFPGWTPIQTVYEPPANHTPRNPSIAFDTHGKAHIIWTEVVSVNQFMIEYDVMYSNNVNGRWSLPIILSDLPTTINHNIKCAPKIAVNDKDHICVVWSQLDALNDNRYKLFCNYFDGSKWSGHYQIFYMDFVNELDPQLTSDDSFFYLAYRTGYEMGNIWASRYNDLDPWTEPSIVNDPIDMLYEILFNGDDAITVASRGGWYVAFTLRGMGEGSKWQLFYDVSFDGGATWGTDSAAISDYDPSERYDDRYPSLKMDGRGKIYALWKMDSDSSQRILWDTDSSGNWDTDVDIASADGNNPPVLEVTPGPLQHGCYIRNYSLSGSCLYYRNSPNGTSWSKEISLSPFGGISYEASGDSKDSDLLGLSWVQVDKDYDIDVVYRERDLN